MSARIRATVAVSAILAVLALAGCASPTVSGGGSGAGGSGAGGSGPGGSSTTTPITGNWSLLSGTDSKGAITPPDQATVTLKLDGRSSGGRGPCNAFGAMASASTTGPLTITLGVHTDMACVEPDYNTTEARYFAALGAIRSASVAGGKLTLTGGGDTLVFARETA